MHIMAADYTNPEMIFNRQGEHNYETPCQQNQRAQAEDFKKYYNSGYELKYKDEEI